jgi:membrane protease subunit HflK
MKEITTRPRNLCWAIAFVGAFMFVIGLIIMKMGNCSAMVPATAAALTVTLLGIVGSGRCAFERRQAIEEAEAQAFRKQHGNSELFDDADEAVRMATRANEQYVKYFIPIFTFLLGLSMTITCAVIWRSWSQQPAFPVAPNPMPLAILAICCCIFALITGSYFIGTSREKGCRWLRPAAAWQFFTGFLFLAAGIALFLEHFQKAADVADITVARVGLAILIVLAIEFLLSFVIEFYRPRMPGEEERPLPESRLLALFTEPGGVARNVAASLDYQFGFQVSEVWFYRFLERTVVPLIVIMAFTLWLQTCLVVISTEENGILERFGRVVNKEPLQPGLYIKLPTPFSRIHRFEIEHIQKIVIGAEHHHGGGDSHDGHDDHNPEQQDHSGKVILWSTKHVDREDNFIVALDQDETSLRKGDDQNQEGAPPLRVGLISAHIPLYFKVKNLYDFYYRHQNPSKTLQNIATRELLRFLASSDFNDVLGPRRSEGRLLLDKRIQVMADELSLGVEIVFIGLAGLHPPVDVGPAYDQVVAAREAKFEQILLADAYAASRGPLAQGQAATLLDLASAYRQERSQVSEAEAERFLRQLKSYEAEPSLFKLNSFLDVMATDGAPARKYILTNKDNREVLILNLEKKLRSSLLDLNLSMDENQ